MSIERLQTLARSPAVHFVLLGSALFVASSWLQPMPDVTADRGPIEIPSARLAEAEQTFRAEHRRLPSAAERAELVETLIDEEVLFRHALALGLQEAEVPRRRLAQIAAFLEPGVEPNAEQSDPIRLARRAVELGLHEGDFVTRRVLVDAARRLVRGAGRLIEPSDAAVAAYLQAHGERFREEDRFRLSHVLASRSRHDDPAAVAGRRLDRTHREGGGSTDALPVGDPSIVPPRLPRLGVRALERRFGAEFARHLAELPIGEWAGPIPSRHGAHLVFVHEHRPGTVPDATAVADAVRAILREEAADRWLAARLQQLRDGRTIRVGVGREVPS